MVKTLVVEEFRLVGRVFSGFGYASRFTQIYRDLFLKYLGIVPYSGTLNIDLGCDASLIFHRLKPIVIPPPLPIYSYVYVYPAIISDYGNVYVVKPCRSIYGWRILEIISDNCLRRELGLSDGDYLEITIYKSIHE